MALALLATIAGAGAAWIGLRGTPVFGIDDANITHIYARNLAGGHGYVYRPGGERVEGSTSALWTALNVLAFLLPAGQPAILLGLCALIAWATVTLAVLVARRIAKRVGVAPGPEAFLTATVMACSPSFFAWTVWSLMDVTLWTLECIGLVWACLRLGTPDGEAPARASGRTAIGLSVLAVLIVATRPEGVAVVAGMAIACAPFQAGPRGRARLATAFGAAMGAFLLLTLARQLYFGYPLPNTYYAKVSSDRLATLLDGLVYVLKALARMPTLAPGLAAWIAILLGVARPAWRERASGQGGGRRPQLKGLMAAGFLVPPLAMIASVIGVSVLEGGDHFAEQRFLQPAAPLLAIGLGICGAWAARALGRGGALSRARVAGARWVMAAGAFIVAATAYAMAPATLGIRNEFVIANDGRAFGNALNRVARRHGPMTVAVIAAGGLPLTFTGRVYDLEGLNWVAMAHADARKAGVKDHASFDPRVFYAVAPDLVVVAHYRLKAGTPWEVADFHARALKGLLTTPRFQRLYQPVRLDTDGGTIGVIASRAWLSRVAGPDITPLPWASLVFQDPWGGPQRAAPGAAQSSSSS